MKNYNIQIDIDKDEFKNKLDIKNGEKGESGDIGPRGLTGKTGKSGKDAKLPTKTELLKLIKPLIPEPIPGEDGKDGMLITPIEVRDKLESLDGNYRLDAKAIKNLPIPIITSTNERRNARNGHIIQDEGTILPTRTNLNFVGAGVTVTDDSANNQTDVTIAADFISSVTDTVSVDLTVSGAGALSAVVLPAGVDHGGLGGLADDDHAQYALLAGRATGQTLIGGTAAGDDLTLRATSNATDGDIIFQTDPTTERGKFFSTGEFSVGGIALVGGEFISFQKNQNALTQVILSNTTDGTNSRSNFFIGTTGTLGMSFNAVAPSFTSSGIVTAGTSVMASTQLGGVNIGSAVAAQMSFWTNNLERMRILSGGNVGIGTNNPTDLLQLSSTASTNLNITNTSNSNAVLELKGGGVGSLEYSIISTGSGSGFGVGRLVFTDETFAEVLVLNSSRVGVNTLSPASRLSVLGNISIGATYATITAPTNGLIVEGNVGMGISLPTSLLHVVGNVPVGGGLTPGVFFNITSLNGQTNRALRVLLNPGQIDANTSIGFEVSNEVAGTGNNLQFNTPGANPIGNSGLNAFSLATTTGTNIAGYYETQNGDINIAIIGKSVTLKNGATNIAVLGTGRNTGTTPIQIGGYFGLHNSTPTFTSAALIADNADQTSPIFLARDNGSVILNLIDGGRMFLGGATSPTAVLHLAAGTATASTAPLKFTTGTSLITAEAGAMEFTTDDLFFTITTGTARKRLLMADATAGLTSGTFPVATTNGRLADSAFTSTSLTSGVYTPSITNATNLDAGTSVTEAQFMRVGNTVTVSGRFTADPTVTATATRFDISLPVSSNLGAVEDAAGVAFSGGISGMGAEINGVAATDVARIQWISGDTTAQSWSYTFSYQVI